MVEDTHQTSLIRRNNLPSAVTIPPQRRNPAPPTTPNGHHHHQNNCHNCSSPIPTPSSFSAADFEFLPLKSPSPSDAYTSLKDILPCSPSSILSPTPVVALAGISSSSPGSGYEISIRNRLVKQAAWAYLQPAASSSPSSSSRRLCFYGESLWPIIADFRRKMSESVTRVYDWLVDALWLILCR